MTRYVIPIFSCPNCVKINFVGNNFCPFCGIYVGDLSVQFVRERLKVC